MSDFHQAHHVKLVEEILEEMDGEELATKANMITGGSMRGEDALKLLKMVALTALHKPETEVIVAGMGARLKGNCLQLFCHGDLAEKILTPNEEVADV